ncbi:MAG: SDR family oxidoreductase [Gammaproteobacteria bacterium]
MAKTTILVAGASGVVGQGVLTVLAGAPDCEVIAVSRRAPVDLCGARHVAADLNDEAQCRELFGGMHEVTHVVYAALYEKPGLVAGWLEQEQIETNERMLRNLFEPLAAAARNLRHVTLLQGTKAYGVHVRPLTIPARENRSEMHEQPNFYWKQEDYLRDKQAGSSWHWTILRPQIIFGLSTGSAMNLIPALGTYAALLREGGEPLVYPGGPGNILEAVDADLLGRVIVWAGRAEAAQNEIFNVTNGDVYMWQNIWPALAEMLGMAPGPAVPCSLGETMPKRAEEWAAICKKYDLLAPDISRFVGESFNYADFCMAYGAEGFGVAPAIVSTVKLRQAGFCEAMDTEDMFRKWFREFERRRLLPPVSGKR